MSMPGLGYVKPDRLTQAGAQTQLTLKTFWTNIE